MSRKIDIVFSFDTTGSMYPCLTEVRRRVRDVIGRLFKEIPDIRIGIIAHGDYCDKGHPYIIKGFDISKNLDEISKFVHGVERTFGGDWPECYEMVLNKVQGMDWRSDADSKIFVMIGDATPHPKGYKYLSEVSLWDWREECDNLKKQGITVYAVQAMASGHRIAEKKFYEEVAKRTAGIKIDLHQLSHIIQLVMAVCFKQASDTQFQAYENEVKSSSMYNRSMAAILDAVAGRQKSTFEFTSDTSLKPVEPARFQTVFVDKDSVIKNFVIDEIGAKFKVGHGFYQWTKRETIQERKEVILRDKKTGDMWTGSEARELIGIPYGQRSRLSPADLPQYDIFVQSTSWNRKLKSGTEFLYESEDWSLASR